MSRREDLIAFADVICVFDLEDGALLRRIVLGKKDITQVLFMVQVKSLLYVAATLSSQPGVGVFSLDLEKGSLSNLLFSCSESSGIAASSNGQFVCSWSKCEVTVFDTKRAEVSLLTHDTDIRILAFHPSKPVLAIGDRRGKIHIWHSLESSNRDVVESVHWHAHGVFALMYAGEDGNLLFSGGEEDAVVVWQLDTRKKLFVPHLGSLGVFQLAVSGNGRVICALCGDNSLFVINSHDLRVSKRILGLRTLGPNLVRSFTNMVCPASDRRCLVFSGKPNTLQWFNVEQDTCTFELEVIHAAVAPRGKRIEWAPSCQVEMLTFGKTVMATVDVRMDKKKSKIPTSTERTLKFWKQKKSGFGWELACMVLRPHGKRILGIAGSPVHNDICTTSSEGRWKLWRMISSEGVFVPLFFLSFFLKNFLKGRFFFFGGLCIFWCLQGIERDILLFQW